MIGRPVLALGATTLALAAVVPTVGADPAASRVIDRTFLCETGYLGGIYQVEIDAGYFTREGSRRDEASASVRSNLVPDFALAWANAREILVNRNRCASTSLKLASSSKGLRGGVVGQLGTKFRCETPRRALVRIRGVFQSPTTLRATTANTIRALRAVGDVKEAAIAIGTQTGRPIAYMNLSNTSKAHLYTSRSCEEG